MFKNNCKFISNILSDKIFHDIEHDIYRDNRFPTFITSNNIGFFTDSMSQLLLGYLIHLAKVFQFLCKVCSRWNSHCIIFYHICLLLTRKEKGNSILAHGFEQPIREQIPQYPECQACSLVPITW